MHRIFLIVVAAFLSQSVFAATYDIHCLNHKGKFSDCKVTVGVDKLVIKYKNGKEKKQDVVILKDSIRMLSAGEYSRRRVAEAVLLTPWILFSKKTRDHVAVEYVDENNNNKATLFEIHKKYGIALKSELRAMSGKVIEEK